MRAFLIILLLWCFALNSFSQNKDIEWLTTINVNRNKSLDPFFKGLTNSAGAISIITPTLIYTLGVIKKDKTLKNKGLYIIETIAVSGIITTALKLSIKRDRPYVTYPYIEKEAGGGTYSFPSGHTSTAFATATSLSISFPKWYIIFPTYTWAGAVGYSRMHLGVHYPSDVAIGAVIGVGSAFLTKKVNMWLQSKKHKKK